MEEIYNFESLADRLLKDGHGTFWFRTSDLLPDIMDGFRKLIAEPEEVRSLWMIDRSAVEPKKEDSEQGADDGLIRRDGEINPANGDRYDKKWYFHLKQGLPEILAAREAVEKLYQREFLKAGMELHRRCTMAMLQLSQKLEKSTGVNFFDLASGRDAMSRHSLRLLHYERPKVGENNLIGDAHADRDLFTIHVWDSRPGLYLHTPDDGCVPYVVKDNFGLVFPGGKAPVLTPKLPWVGHEICDDDAGSVQPRMSAVFFFHTDTPLAEELLNSCRIAPRRKFRLSDLTAV